jgi:hypothetical protein
MKMKKNQQINKTINPMLNVHDDDSLNWNGIGMELD